MAAAASASVPNKRHSLLPVAVGSSLPRTLASSDLSSQALDSPTRPDRPSSPLVASSSSGTGSAHRQNGSQSRIPINPSSSLGKSGPNGTSPTNLLGSQWSDWQSHLSSSDPSSSHRPSSPLAQTSAARARGSSPTPPSAYQAMRATSPLNSPPVATPYYGRAASPSPLNSSGGPGASPNARSQSGRVITELQDEIAALKTHVMIKDGEVRTAKRSMAGFAKEVEDLRDRMDRSRLEIASLNSVVARRERTLQETLERARVAEAEAVSLKMTSKEENKQIHTLQTSLDRSTALFAQSDLSHAVLRESLAGLKSSWTKELASIREGFARELERLKEGQGKDAELRRELDEIRRLRAEELALRTTRSEQDQAFALRVQSEMAQLQEGLISALNGEEELKGRVLEAEEEVARLQRMIRVRKAREAVGAAGAGSEEDDGPAVSVPRPP